MRRAGILLFIVLYVTATAGAAGERAISFADHVLHATGAQEHAAGSSHNNSTIGLPKFSHAKKIDTDFVFSVEVVLVGSPLLTLRDFQNPTSIDYSAGDYDTSPARAPPFMV